MTDKSCVHCKAPVTTFSGFKTSNGYLHLSCERVYFATKDTQSQHTGDSGGTDHTDVDAANPTSKGRRRMGCGLTTLVIVAAFMVVVSIVAGTLTGVDPLMLIILLPAFLASLFSG